MKSTSIKIFLVLSLLAVISCSEDKRAFTALTANATILAFGDSLTAGRGAAPSQSYPAVLQQLSRIKVINAGVSGEISAHGLRRLPALLKKHQPELIIICHGGNDILRRINLQDTKNNIIKMIELSESFNVQVLLLAVPKPSLLVPAAKFYFDIAAITAAELDAETMPTTLKNNKLKSDTYHPNAAGYNYIARQIYSRLNKLGAF